MNTKGRGGTYQGWRWLGLPLAALALLSWHAARSVPPRRARIERRRETWAQLVVLQRESVLWRQAAERYRLQYQAAEPADWAALLGTPPPGGTVNLLPLQAQAAAGADRLLQQVIEFHDVRIESMADWIYRAETGNPPWRLVGVELEAAGQRGRVAHGRLRFESLVPALNPVIEAAE